MWLYDSEDVAGRIFSIGEPANTGDLHLWHTNLSAAFFNLLYRLIERRHRDRIYRAGTLSLAETGQTAIDSRVLIVARGDEPVLNWPTLELFELPAENIPVKRLHCFRILRINFEVNYALHISILSRS